MACAHGYLGLPHVMAASEYTVTQQKWKDEETALKVLKDVPTTDMVS